MCRLRADEPRRCGWAGEIVAEVICRHVSTSSQAVVTRWRCDTVNIDVSLSWLETRRQQTPQSTQGSCCCRWIFLSPYPSYLHLATSEMCYRSGGRGILNKKNVSVLQYCVLLWWCTKIRAVLTGWSTVSSFDLAWFSSLSSKHLCVFGLHGAVYRNFHWLKINRMTPFCNLFMERPSYIYIYRLIFWIHTSLYLLVSWAWWDWSLMWLGRLTRKIVPEITCVSSGTLNPTIPFSVCM